MSKFDLDAEFVRKMAALLKETGLSEIEYAEGDKRIKVGLGGGAPIMHVAAPVAAPVAGGAPAAAKIDGTPVASPMVGTVYLASSPDAPPFVKVGDTVKQGDTLVIIEAMKVMNPIKAAKAGTISQILVENATPVEFGETLMIIA